MEITRTILDMEVLDLTGAPIYVRTPQGQLIAKKGSTTEPETYTVGNVIRQALTATIEAVKETDDVKYNNYKLAKKLMKLKAKETLKLKAEQLVKIKEKTSAAFGIEVQGFIYDLLEGEELVEKDDEDGNSDAETTLEESSTKLSAVPVEEEV